MTRSQTQTLVNSLVLPQTYQSLWRGWGESASQGGCGLEALASHHSDISTGLFECPHNVRADFPPVRFKTKKEGIWTRKPHASISPSSFGFHSPLSTQCDARRWHSLESSWRLATESHSRGEAESLGQMWQESWMEKQLGARVPRPILAKSKF